MFSAIAKPFGWLMMWLYDLLNNYGLALIAFALIVKIILLPFQMKSKRGSMRQARLMPKMKEIENGSAEIPCLVHTDLEVVDQNLHMISPSFFRFSGLQAERCALNQLLIQNIVTGCTMMINHALWELAAASVDEGQVLMHDWWFALIAAAVGRIGFIGQPLILYRQHGKNSVGAKDVYSVEAVTTQMTKYKANHNALLSAMLQAGMLLSILDQKLSVQNREMLRAFSQAAQAGKMKRISVSIQYGIWKNGLIKKVAQLVYY